MIHPRVTRLVVISGTLDDDTKRYQVRAVELVIKESKR